MATSGDRNTDWTSLREWVVALRDLHERARQGQLPADELRRYKEERETLAKAILAAQRLRATPGAKGRQALRVARELPLELIFDGTPLHLKTLDVGVGGFAVMMTPPPRVGEKLGFSLELDAGDPISGRVRVVSTQRKGRPYRVAFRFDDLPHEQMERVENAVFEAALQGVLPDDR